MVTDQVLLSVCNQGDCDQVVLLSVSSQGDSDQVLSVCNRGNWPDGAVINV